MRYEGGVFPLFLFYIDLTLHNKSLLSVIQSIRRKTIETTRIKTTGSESEEELLWNTNEQEEEGIHKKT